MAATVPAAFVPAPASLSAPLLLARLLAQVPGLNPADAARIARCWAAPLALKRHAYLVRPGEVEQRLALVTSGCYAFTTPRQLAKKSASALATRPRCCVRSRRS